MSTPAELLRDWVVRRAPPEGAAWFEETLERLAREPSDRALYIALGFAPRRLGKADLALSPEELEAAVIEPPPPAPLRLIEAVAVGYVA